MMNKALATRRIIGAVCAIVLTFYCNHHVSSFSSRPTAVPNTRRVYATKSIEQPNVLDNDKDQRQQRLKESIKRLKLGSNKNNKPSIKVNITSIEELDAHWQDEKQLFRDPKSGKINYNALLSAANVQGDTQVIGSPQHKNYTHPVLQLMYERKRNKYSSNAKSNNDKTKISLAVEGGGMRGCVSAGMVCAIHHLNLTDTIDVIYGSSAGSMIGAYLITGQVPYFGPEVYYDKLTTAGKGFIDTRRLLRAVGLGLLDPRLLRDVIMRRSHGKPVLNLSFLLEATLQFTKPLDWTVFKERQATQPLKIVTSGLQSEKAVILDMESGAFKSLAELGYCMHASCLLPGIAGPIMNIDMAQVNNNNSNIEDDNSQSRQKFVLQNNLRDANYEPLADALVYEPLPYRSAVDKDGATHVLVLRTRPDGTDVSGKGSFFERLIFRRTFMRKNRLPNVYRHFTQQMHKYIYSRDVLELNADAYSMRNYTSVDENKPHLMTVACPPGSPEVTRLETGRETIFAGIRRGFARAYDCLVEDPELRGKGNEMALQIFPDEIMDYDPAVTGVDDVTKSAFSVYLKESGIQPKSWTEKAQ